MSSYKKAQSCHDRWHPRQSIDQTSMVPKKPHLGVCHRSETNPEVSKCQKYQHLPPTHCFTPVAFESLGAVGSRTLKDIGRRIRLETGEPKATFYLLQSSLN